MNLKKNDVILSAGMWRSGSTLLFNVLREILLSIPGYVISTGYATQTIFNKKADFYIVKLHYFTDYFLDKADYIFYTYRDVRTSMVSAFRMFNEPIQFGNVCKNIENYYIAKEKGVLIKYEQLVQQPILVTKDILNTLGWTDILDASVIVRRAVSWRPPLQDNMDSISLLHKNHFTNTGDDDWRTMIPLQMQKAISCEFRDWLLECGYPLE